MRHQVVKPLTKFLLVLSLFVATLPSYAADLPVRVAGTFIFEDSREVILEIAGTGVQEIFLEGNSIPGGYVISKISKETIVLSKNGENIILPFLNSTGGGVAATDEVIGLSDVQPWPNVEEMEHPEGAPIPLLMPTEQQ